ncbi:MAG TPA: PIN domain-containing protein [Solirubrobacteraceae bacterium]|nr:PIN domain-containing protein [Solirubrobacteraceae bacterium]
MKKAADSSVTIAALMADHPDREIAEHALKQCAVTIAHTAIETYSVLTRLPSPHRLTRADAARIVDARLPSKYVVLDAGVHSQAHTRLAAAGIGGGSTYDGLIALTALEHNLELLTRDGRAVRSYRALGVRFTLIE